jgi:hypothetical protein
MAVAPRRGIGNAGAVVGVRSHRRNRGHHLRQRGRNDRGRRGIDRPRDRLWPYRRHGFGLRLRPARRDRPRRGNRASQRARSFQLGPCRRSRQTKASPTAASSRSWRCEEYEPHQGRVGGLLRRAGHSHRRQHRQNAEHGRVQRSRRGKGAPRDARRGGPRSKQLAPQWSRINPAQKPHGPKGLRRGDKPAVHRTDGAGRDQRADALEAHPRRACDFARRKDLGGGFCDRRHGTVLNPGGQNSCRHSRGRVESSDRFFGRYPRDLLGSYLMGCAPSKTSGG